LSEVKDIIRIFVISTLKSGSSFVVMLLQKVTGFGHLRPVLSGEPLLEADPYLPIIEASKQPSVSQLHCHAKQRTLELCGQLSIKPIFLTRNVFDSLLSMKEYIDNVPHQHLFPNYYRLTAEEDKRAFIVNVYAPIFVRLVAGWYEAWKAQEVPILWCTYDTFFHDPLLHAGRMLQHLAFDCPDEKIRHAINATQQNRIATKFNIGVAGRGISAFMPAEQQRVLDLIDSYKGFDAREGGLVA
jgi:hypothetical protein